jgi:L-arabinose isomerase
VNENLAVFLIKLPKLPVAGALWLPRPGLKITAVVWIYVGGAHHTSFSFCVTTEHLKDFAANEGNVERLEITPFCGDPQPLSQKVDSVRSRKFPFSII